MTTDRPLTGKRILVLEDDYYLASDEKAMLERAGATIVGPFGTGYRASDLPLAQIDGAVVDINLGLGPSFDVALALADGNVPFLFATGYDAGVIPQSLSHVQRIEKPFRERDLIAMVAGLLDS